MEKQRLLNKLYARYWDDISELRSQYPGLSAPLLIKIPTRYLSQDTKLMIIGQQTQGWGGESIEDALKSYEEFKFGEHYYSSPFWNITRKVERALGVDEYAITWSNLNRCDYNGRRPPAGIENELRAFLPMLVSEIEILKPDIVIFFHGTIF